MRYVFIIGFAGSKDTHEIEVYAPSRDAAKSALLSIYPGAEIIVCMRNTDKVN